MICSGNKKFPRHERGKSGEQTCEVCWIYGHQRVHARIRLDCACHWALKFKTMKTRATGTLQKQVEDLRDELAHDGWDRLSGLRLLRNLKRVHSLLEYGAIKDACAALVSLLSASVREKEIAAARLHTLLDLTSQLAVALGSEDVVRHSPSPTMPPHIEVAAVGTFVQDLQPLRRLLDDMHSTLKVYPQPDGLPSALGANQIVLADMEWVLSLTDAKRRSLTAKAGKAASWIVLTDPRGNFPLQIELLRSGVKCFIERPLLPERLATVIEELRDDETEDRYRVMVVTEEQSALDMFSAALNEAGTEVLPCENSLLALDFIEEYQPDALVVDIEMAACRGSELVTLIRQKGRYAQLPVIYLTTWSERQRQLAARQSATEDFLPKSGDPAVLVAAVTTSAKRHRRLQRTAAEVAARDENLNRALAVAQVGSWVLDANLNEVHWSPEARRIIGWPEGSSFTIDEYLAKIVFTTDRAAVKQFRRAVLKGEYAAVEHRMLVGYDIRWVDVRAERILDAEGNILRYVGTMQDITARRRAELGHDQTKRVLSQFIDATPIPVFVIDAQHRVTQWNRACESVLGVAATDMVGTKDLWKAFYPKPRPVLANLVVNNDQAALAAMQHYYTRTIRPSSVVHGAYEAEKYFPNLGRWLSFVASPLRDDNGRIVGAIETLQDITERKKAEIALLESRTLMASVLSSASYSIIATDPQGIITVFNRGAEALLGYAADEMIGKQNPALFHDAAEIQACAEMLTRELGIAVTPGFDALVAKTRTTGEPDERESTYIHKNGGRIPVLLSTTAIRDQQGITAGYLSIAANIESR